MKTLIGILIIALLGQVAGAIDGSVRTVRTSAAPAVDPAPTAPTDDPSQPAELGFYIDVSQAQALYEAGDAVFADARPLDQYEEGHIAGAEHLDPDAFFGGAEPDFVYLYPPDQIIVIYCPGGECDASELVSIRLQERGFSNTHILKPGYPGWVEAGLPTEAGSHE